MLVFIVFVIMPIAMLGASALTYYICKSKKWEVTELAKYEAVAILMRQYRNNRSDDSIDNKYLEKRLIEIKIDLFGDRIEQEMEKSRKDNVFLFRPHGQKTTH